MVQLLFCIHEILNNFSGLDYGHNAKVKLKM